MPSSFSANAFFGKTFTTGALAGEGMLAGTTLAAASTVDSEVKTGLKNGSNVDAAKAVGEAIGRRAIEAGIKEVVFDRGGRIYHGRVKALADGARSAGLEF